MAKAKYYGQMSAISLNWGIQICIGNVVIIAIKDTVTGPTRSQEASDLADAIVASELPQRLLNLDMHGLSIDLTDDHVKQISKLIGENNELKRHLAAAPVLLDSAIVGLQELRNRLA
jgi:hypothetical protein